MTKLLQIRFILLLVIWQGINVLPVFSKTIYKPSSFGSMDLNSESSQWCYNRSKQSNNFILFWEAGYGANPNTVSDNAYKVNIDGVLSIAEASFRIYRDSLKFIQGSSKTDSYKMIILLYYSTVWQASGSGVDDMIGLLSLSANAAQAGGSTVAHEVGHCFQYQVHSDGHTGGWMYGFGVNGAGGNCWWEMCAQWQAFKVLPNEQFTNWNFAGYLSNCHKHILHETPRYSNYFIQDYWTYLRGADFIGRLWRDSNYPEDPVDAYKRIASVTQQKFNDEIYDCAVRFVTWDIPTLRNNGKNYIDSRPMTPMKLSVDSFWLVDSSKCIENYGYNAVRLNVPDKATTIKVYFEGYAGASGFRLLNKIYAGWRYGIVAFKEDGTRVYSPMRSASYNQSSATNPKDTFTFDCPEKVSRLWLVVTGAPTTHWHHAWDDNDANDEQWPYRVKFDNTNIYGYFSPADHYFPFDETSGSVAACVWTGVKTTLSTTGAAWVNGKYGNGLYLDGVSSAYASLPDGLLSSFKDFTISAWVKLDALDQWARIFDFGTGTSNYMFLTPKSGSGYLRYAITTGGGSSEQQINSTTTLPVGTWTHVAVTLKDSVGIMYVNGVEVGRNSSIKLTPSALGAARNYIGKSQWPDPYLKGTIDEFRIYKRALTPAQVLQLKNALTQTITFSTIPAKTMGDPDFTLDATASSGLEVTYSSANTAVATVVNGKIHITGGGNCIIYAVQGGDSVYAAARFGRTLTVNKGAQTITFPVIPSKAFGDPDFAPGATASSGLPVSYTSSNTSVATIVNSKIHIVAAGTTIITAFQSGNISYSSAPDISQTLTVTDVPALSAETYKSGLSFSLYPNPVDDLLFITIDGANRFDVEICTISGKKVYSKCINNDITVNLQGILPGIYIVKISDGKNTFIKRIVKSN